jgi:hypothetical protein
VCVLFGCVVGSSLFTRFWHVLEALRLYIYTWKVLRRRQVEFMPSDATLLFACIQHASHVYKS